MLSPEAFPEESFGVTTQDVNILQVLDTSCLDADRNQVDGTNSRSR